MTQFQLDYTHFRAYQPRTDDDSGCRSSTEDVRFSKSSTPTTMQHLNLVRHEPRGPNWKDLEEASQRVATIVPQLSQRRQEAFLLRDRTIYERTGLLYKHGHLLESMPLCRRCSNTITFDECQQSQLSGLNDQHAQDCQRFQDGIAEVTAQQERLSRIELDMQAQEDSLLEAARHILQLSQGMLSTIPSGMSSVFSAAPPASLFDKDESNETPAPLLDYYDKQGDFNVMHDRVVEIEEEYQEARVDRIFREDQGVVLEISEQNFEANYEHARKIAVRDLESAQRAAELARERCLQHGIDPDYHLKLQHEALDMDGVASDIYATSATSYKADDIDTSIFQCISNSPPDPATPTTYGDPNLAPSLMDQTAATDEKVREWMLQSEHSSQCSNGEEAWSNQSVSSVQDCNPAITSTSSFMSSFDRRPELSDASRDHSPVAYSWERFPGHNQVASV